MPLAHLPRLVRTVGHLRFSQVAARLERTVERRFRVLFPPSCDGAAPSDSRLTDDFPDVPLPSHFEPASATLIDQLAAGDFVHLNERKQIGRQTPDWRLGARRDERLWSVTLHYHAWAYGLAERVVANDARSGDAAALLEHYLSNWIRRVPASEPGAAELAWNSYAIATRLPWWIRTWQLLGANFFDRRPEFREAFLGSLWRQAKHLHRHLEWDLRANHLLRDLVGLAWAGRFFHGAEPLAWLNTVRKHLPSQIAEQIQNDGGHFERSASYHLEALDDFQSLAALIQDEPLVVSLNERIDAMTKWLAWMRHPDGQLAQLNDGGRGPTVAPPLAPRGGCHLADTGVVVWRGEPWTMYFDVGKIGPEFQPGHGHADTLTVECSYRGRRLFVDPGCFGYDDNEQRHYDRSTAAHNTVCVDDTNSSEVWHIFRCGRRARPLEVTVQADSCRLQAKASHDGYNHLTGAPRHTRRVLVGDETDLVIEDEVRGERRHSLQGGWLLDPRWQVTRTNERDWELSDGDMKLRLMLLGPDSLNVTCEQRPLHPDYGIEQTTARICWRYEGPLPARILTTVHPAPGILCEPQGAGRG